MKLFYDHIASPIGAILMVSDGKVLNALEFADNESESRRRLARVYPGLDLVRAPDPGGFKVRVDAYFAGDIASLDAICVSARGTPFQLRVWAALREIPAGTTTSYGALARRLGLIPGASRAVGLANGANPISLVVPCHRVIGTDGKLVGYGGGLERKLWLLEHEGVRLRLPPSQATAV